MFSRLWTREGKTADVRTDYPIVSNNAQLFCKSCKTLKSASLSAVSQPNFGDTFKYREVNRSLEQLQCDRSC